MLEAIRLAWHHPKLVWPRHWRTRPRTYHYMFSTADRYAAVLSQNLDIRKSSWADGAYSRPGQP